MSSLTLTPVALAAKEDVSTSNKPGIIARVVERATEAQTARARQIVYRHLAGYSDQRLAELGFNAAEIADIRRIGSVPIAYWA